MIPEHETDSYFLWDGDDDDVGDDDDDDDDVLVKIPE